LHSSPIFFIRGAILFFYYEAAIEAAGNLATRRSRLDPGAVVETYLTIEELAEYLKLTAQTIQRWVRNRDVPFHKVKSVIRFRVSEIEKWIDEGGLVSQEEKPENIEAGLFDGDSSPDELGQLGEKGAGE